MPIIRSDDLAIDLIDRGEGDVVMLLHSAGMGAAQWRGVIERMQDEFRLIAPNLRGYGRSASWPKGQIADFAAELELLQAVLATLTGRIHLVGHSLGAYLALHLAKAAPSRLTSLTLIEPVALGILRSEGEDAALAEVGRMIEACIASFEAGDVNAAMTHFVDYWDGPGSWEAIPKAQRLFIYARAQKMYQEVRAVWHDAVALDAYRDIAAPTQVLIGADTTHAAKRMAELLAGAIVHADCEALPGAGHMLPMTHAAALAERLKRDFQAYRQR